MLFNRPDPFRLTVLNTFRINSITVVYTVVDLMQYCRLAVMGVLGLEGQVLGLVPKSLLQLMKVGRVDIVQLCTQEMWQGSSDGMLFTGNTAEHYFFTSS